MKSFLSISKNNSISSLCIGKFDGVHIAHQSIFSKLPPKHSIVLLINKCDEGEMLTPNPQNFTSLPVYFLELEKIKNMGDKEFSDFLLFYLPYLQKIVVGYDFCFGKNRAYTSRDLQKFFHVEIVPEVCWDGESVHTQNIVCALKNGEIQKANAMLGRVYSVCGEVVSGQGIGNKELVPTLNLNVKNYILPQSGVYTTLCKIGKKKYKSVSFLGHRVSTDGQFAIETHLIDVYVNDRPRKIEIFFYDKIRNNQNFKFLKDLKEQILSDIQIARNFFGV